MPLLTPADHAFFQENGYILLRGIVPKAACDAVIDAIWTFLGMDRENPDDWYREPHRVGGMVEMYQHQALWDNRQNPSVYQAFSELLQTERLWVSLDRASMKPPQPPAHPAYDHKGFMHWDADTSQKPAPEGVQGVLYLADTAENQGGFQCAPSLFREMMRDYEAWVDAQPADRNPTRPDLTGHPVLPIPGKTGDLLIWHRLLAHGNGHNVSGKPRFAQYITMFPARPEDTAARDARIACWRDRLPPAADWAPGDPRRWEQTHGTTAVLTPLGRRLLGLDDW